MDIADQAYIYEEQHRLTELAQHKAQQTAGQHYCQDCDCEIPAARRKANPQAVRCITCQEKYERCKA